MDENCQMSVIMVLRKILTIMHHSMTDLPVALFFDVNSMSGVKEDIPPSKKARTYGHEEIKNV
jgi:hypothetical protein